MSAAREQRRLAAILAADVVATMAVRASPMDRWRRDTDDTSLPAARHIDDTFGRHSPFI